MKTITVTGTNMFALALLYLGDATQWNRIAQANNVTDPFITGTQTLNIPPVNPSATGGVYVA